MKIGKNIEITKDRYNVIITERVEAKEFRGKKGKNKFTFKKSYYPCLELALLSVFERSIELETVGKLLESIKKAKKKIIKAVQ